MDITEARALLGVSEYASTEEIQQAQDRIIDQAFPAGDLALLRRAARAVAELFVEGGHYPREQANRYVVHMDAFYDTQIGEIDQRTTRIRDLTAALDALGPTPSSSETFEEALAQRLADDPQYQAALANMARVEAERKARKAARKEHRAKLTRAIVRTITFRR